MTRLGGRRSAPSYDLFKFIVAMFLVIILIILLLRGHQQLPMQPVTTSAQQIETVTSTPETPPAAASSTATLPPSVTPTIETSPTLIPATETLPPPVTYTPETRPTDTPIVVTPETEPAVTEATPTSDSNACPSAPPRLQLGDKVRVLYRLNFRVQPGLGSPIIHTNGIGTLLEVIGGPVCTIENAAGGRKAYLWWNVRMEDGRQGWSAEAPLVMSYYFLEAVR